MPEARVASTGRTDGPLLQKPSPQVVQFALAKCTSLRVKQNFFYPLVFHRGDTSAGSPNFPRSISADPHVETIVSTRAVSDDPCPNLTLTLPKLLFRRVEVFAFGFPIIAAAALAEAGEEFIINGARLIGFCFQMFPAKDNHAADFDREFRVCCINHGQVHADAANDFDFLIMQDSGAAIALIDGDAVRITCADHGHAHISRGDIGAIIADGLARFNIADLEDWREEGRYGFCDFLARLMGCHAAVKANARADHLEVIRLAEIYARRIRERQRREGQLRGGFAEAL